MMKLKRARPVGQAAKTSPSHGENMGSIPVRVTKNAHECVRFFFFISREKYFLKFLDFGHYFRNIFSIPIDKWKYFCYNSNYHTIRKIFHHCPPKIL